MQNSRAKSKTIFRPPALHVGKNYQYLLCLITKGYDKDDHFLQGEFEIQFEYAKTTKTVEVRVGLIFLTFVHRATSYSIQIHI